jgi:hypothetical protein
MEEDNGVREWSSEIRSEARKQGGDLHHGGWGRREVAGRNMVVVTRQSSHSLCQEAKVWGSYKLRWHPTESWFNHIISILITPQ